MVMDYTILILLLPLCSFLAIGLSGTKLKPTIAGIGGTLSLAAITLLSYYTAYTYFTTQNVNGVWQTLTPHNFTWLHVGEKLHIDLGILLDPISVMMLVVISTVSLMVHIYSMGYMKGEKGFQRYYAFLSLFTFSMLGLVLATNIFQMYIFWELVGVSSYLLIGFYYTKPTAVAASKKAFIVTRFADFFFLIGILVLSYFTQTFDFGTLMTGDGTILNRAIGSTFIGASALTWAMSLIFIGAAGKSAMFPLHIWLPDAMEPARIGPDTCCHDGGSRCLSGSTDVPHLYRFHSGSTARYCLGGRFYRHVCSRHRRRTDQYQAGTGLFHHLPDRIYDGRAGDIHINATRRV